MSARLGVAAGIATAVLLVSLAATTNSIAVRFVIVGIAAVECVFLALAIYLRSPPIEQPRIPDRPASDAPLAGLQLRQRFEVWRAVYAGTAVDEPALAPFAVRYAKRLCERHRPWSRRWLQSFVPAWTNVHAYAAFAVLVLALVPAFYTAVVVIAGLLFLALLTRPRRRRKAAEAEAANRRLIERA